MISNCIYWMELKGIKLFQIIVKQLRVPEHWLWETNCPHDKPFPFYKEERHLPKVTLLLGGDIVYLPVLHSEIQCHMASFLEKKMLPVHLPRFLSISNNFSTKFLFNFKVIQFSLVSEYGSEAENSNIIFELINAMLCLSIWEIFIRYMLCSWHV